MTDRNREQRSANDLRSEAEKRLAQLEEISSGGDSEELRRLIHELRVHQIELEMQNAQLAQSQAELETSRQKYSDLFDFAPVGYLSLDENGVVLEANLTIAALLGTERRWILNRPFQVHVAAADRDLFHAHIQSTSRTTERDRCDLRLRTKSGSEFYSQLDSLCIQADGKRSLRTAITDISQRRQAQEDLRGARDNLEQRVQERTAELEKANVDLREIPSRLLVAQEAERKRIGSELHDSIGQTLAALKFWIEMILKLRDEGDFETAILHLEKFVPMLQCSIEETRAIYMGLRPSILDNLGLLTTLEWLCREFMKLYPRIHVELEKGIEEEEIPENLKISIFRIAQESLNNAAKYSKAEWVDLSLARSGDRIALTIADVGIGMDRDRIAQNPCSTGLGLVGMRERAEITGGRFSIESTPGLGTIIRASWPVRD
jgi:PAS domain S-box-containing protein